MTSKTNRQFRLDNFTGGIAEGTRIGYDGSFNDGMSLDLTSNPDKLQVMPLLQIEETQSLQLTHPIQHITNLDEEKFFYDAGGRIIRKDYGNYYYLLKTYSSSVGNGFAVFNEELWVATNTQIHKIVEPKSTGSTQFFDNYFISTNELDSLTVLTGQTYTPPTSILETTANKYSFIPTVSTITGCLFAISFKGTGDITITVHDSSNNIIDQKTYLNADLPTAGFDIRFEFYSVLNLTVGSTYHIHITSTVADATVVTGTVNDLSTATGAIYKYNNLFIGRDVDQEQDITEVVGYTNKFVIPTTINQASNNGIEFVPTKSSLKAISLYYANVASGNSTIYVYDSFKKLVGSKTFTPQQYSINRVDFTNPLDLVIGATYTIYITHSVGSTAFLYVKATDDKLSETGWYTHTAILDSNENHQMKEFFNLLCIANGRFLATVNDVEIFNPEAIKIPNNQKIRCLETIGDHLAVACNKYNEVNKNITSSIYFWDGLSSSFTQYITLNGGIHAMYNIGNNMLYIIHGDKLTISVYTGGVTPKRQIKNLSYTQNANVNKSAISVYNGQLMFAVASFGDNDLDRCLYTYGQRSNDYQNILNKPFKISTEQTGSNIDITAIYPVSSHELYVAYSDLTTNTYRIDNINLSRQASAYIETLVIDGGYPAYQKLGKYFRIVTDPLVRHQQIIIHYKIDGDDYKLLGEFNGEINYGGIYKSFQFNKRFYKVQFLIEMNLIHTTNSNQTYENVKITSIELDYEVLSDDHKPTKVSY